ncbi:hypothetical protein M5689_012262 [Euphorbia peplus]|nr:hypothetical protein M5689_012262 [Euphorbia peplus]
MVHSRKSKINITCLFLIGLVLVLGSVIGSQARQLPPPPPEKILGLGSEPMRVNYKEFLAMLPKGPLPPSGPSPGINQISSP